MIQASKVLMGKRTTLILQENSLTELKKLAAEEERTLSELVDEILRLGIQERKSKGTRRVNIDLPSFSMGEAQANLADRDQLERLMS